MRLGDPVAARVAWTRLAGPYDADATALVRAVGPVEALEWLCSGSEAMPLSRGTVSPLWAESVASWRARLDGLCEQVDADLRRTGQVGTVLVIPEDLFWPERLGSCTAFCLWVQGRVGLLSSRRMVAVTGAQASTTYGRCAAAALAEELTTAGVVVVAGD